VPIGHLVRCVRDIGTHAPRGHPTRNHVVGGLFGAIVIAAVDHVRPRS
jgi:hypothetical protein